MAVVLPPEEGEDFNDLLLREGPEAIATLIADAEAITETESTLLIGQHRPINYQGSGEAIPTLRADEGDLARSVERVWSLLMASNRTPWVLRFAGQPTWVVPDNEGRPTAVAITEERLRHILARLAHWKKLNGKGELVAGPPPIAVVKSVLATPDPALPVLVGIVNTPVFGRGGTLLTTPGYHPDARLLYPVALQRRRHRLAAEWVRAASAAGDRVRDRESVVMRWMGHKVPPRLALPNHKFILRKFHLVFAKNAKIPVILNIRHRIFKIKYRKIDTIF